MLLHVYCVITLATCIHSDIRQLYRNVAVVVVVVQQPKLFSHCCKQLLCIYKGL